jgi:hypothetical protein
MTIPNEIEAIIQKSGNSFHSRVAQALSTAGWKIRVSPFYMDQSLNKPREIDIIAEKAYVATDDFTGRPAGHVVVRLFVECKFIPAHTVFWMTEKELELAKELLHNTGIFDLNNVNCSKHHYLSGMSKVAKVFATESQRETENDPFFKALNQTLNGYVALRHQSPYIGRAAESRIHEIARLSYPVILCSSFDKIYGVPFYGDSSPYRVQDNFQLEAQYAYSTRGVSLDEYFLVDVVEFNQIDKFLDSIGLDAELAGFFKK